MVSALTSNQMRDIENEAFASGRVDSRSLMETAGLGVAKTILERVPDRFLSDGDVLTLCGPGNNGGDGFVAARHLAERARSVEVLFYGRSDRLSQDAKANYDLWRHSHSRNTHQMGFPDLQSDDVALLEQHFCTDKPLLIIDALFGIGLTRSLSALDHLFDVWSDRRSSQNGNNTFCVAVDVPSGLTDTGPVSDEINRVCMADLTVTFHRMKKAHLAAPQFCGEVVVVDIGL